MAQILEAMRAEIREETATTRRVLERVPADKLSWKPHPKSMSLGQLSLHIATIPRNMSKMAQLEEFDVAEANFDFPDAASTDELLSALDEGLKTAEDYLGSLSESAATGDWRLNLRGKELFTVTRLQMLRTILLNHWYHHRGQLSVYLRLLDVPLPVIYGRSADENPFA